MNSQISGSASVSPLNYSSHRVWPDLLYPIRQWIDALEVKSPKAARLFACLIPAQCPFERKISLFGHKVAHIPPLCKLNPLYEQFVGLRFRALCYLVDQCGEDITAFIQAVGLYFYWTLEAQATRDLLIALDLTLFRSVRHARWTNQRNVKFIKVYRNQGRISL